MYLEFKSITLLKIIVFIRLIVLNGLISSMWFKYKFMSQMDAVAYNDLYAWNFRENIV